MSTVLLQENCKNGADGVKEEVNGGMTSDPSERFLNLKKNISDLAMEMSESAVMGNGEQLIEQLGLQFILHAFFVDMNWKPVLDLKISVVNFMNEHHIKKVHKGLVRTLLERLEHIGVLTKAGGNIVNPCWIISKLPPPNNIIISTIKYLQTKLLEFEEITVETDFTNYTQSHLFNILSGKRNVLNVLYPPEKSCNYQYAVDSLYKKSIFMKCTKSMYAVHGFIDIIKQLHNNGQKDFKILEIGAGTDGTTIPILQSFNELEWSKDINIHYTFTDISNFFIAKAQDKLNVLFPNIKFEFRILDIELPIGTQGFGNNIKENGYDVIIAADVFYATRYLDDTVEHTKEILKPGGLLIITEIFKSTIFLECSFGLTEGWWRFSDNIRSKLCSLIDQTKWEQLLLDMGFTDTFSVAIGRQNHGALFALANSS